MVVEVKFDLPIVEEANLAIVGSGYEIVKKQVVREVSLGASNCGANNIRLEIYSTSATLITASYKDRH
jgi:hypothetical protein